MCPALTGCLDSPGYTAEPITESHQLSITVVENVRNRDSTGRMVQPWRERHDLPSFVRRIAPPLASVLHTQRAAAQSREADLHGAAEALLAGEPVQANLASRPELKALRDETRGLPQGSLAQQAAVSGVRSRFCWRRILKTGVPAWSPTTFAGDIGLISAQETCCLVIDFDDGTHIETVHEAVGDEVFGVIRTSLSHTPAAPRFHLILPLAQPLAPGLTRRVLKDLASRLPGTPDPAVLTPAHRFLLPARLYADGTYQRVILGETSGHLLKVLAEHFPVPMRPHRSLSTTRGRAPQLDARQREAIGRAHGGRLAANETAMRGVTCPHCRRPSVFFSLLPERGPVAFCNHRNSCAWRGFIQAL